MFGFLIETAQLYYFRI